MNKLEKLKFDKYEVEIDRENLRFNEDTLTLYIQTESGHYDGFGAYLALAERNLQNKEIAHEKLYCERFIEAKEDGGSDKLAEAKAKADQDVNCLREEIAEARYAVNRLKNHLKAWDKSHDNAQSLGHMLRKQMDKLNSDIPGTRYYGDRGTPGLDDAIMETVTPFDKKGLSGGFEENLSVENMF